MARAHSNLFRINVISSSTLPLWRQGQALWEWRRLSTNGVTSLARAALGQPALWNQQGFVPSLGNTGSAAGIDKWCGGALDRRTQRFYMAWPGGHSDGVINPIIMIDLSLDTPQFVAVKQPSAAGTSVSDAEVYTDGRGTSSHTYWGNQLLENKNKLIRFGVQAAFGTGLFAATSIDSYDLISGAESHSALGRLPIADNGDMPTCKHPITENIYYTKNNSGTWRVWDTNLSTFGPGNFSILVSGAPAFNAGPCAIDSTRNALWAFGGKAPSSSWHKVNLTTGAVSALTITGSNAVINGFLRGISAAGWGIDFQPDVNNPNNDCFIMRHGYAGGLVVRVNAVTGVLDYPTTTGGDTIPMTPAFDTSANGCYSKFIRVPAYQGYFYQPGYPYDSWFLRTE